MKKASFLFVAGLAAGVLPTLAIADDGVAYNIGAVSDYRYRGISQTKLDPALQGGIDYTKGALYVGTWLSNIQWIHDDVTSYNNAATTKVSNGNAPVEWDLYGGLRGDVMKDLNFDIGALAYVYVNGAQALHSVGMADPNTGEIYGSLSYGVYTAKVSVALTNLFGFGDSKGSQYYELSANYDLGGGWSLTPDIGYQAITGNFVQKTGGPNPSYADYSLTVGKDFGKGLTASLEVIGTDAKKIDYMTSNGKFNGRTGVVAGVKYTF